MDLKSFIKQAIIDIVGAVGEADKELKREILFPTRQGENIHFDLAVTVEDTKVSGGGIQVLNFIQGGVENETKNIASSRLSFSLFIAQLDKEKQAKEREKLR